MRRVIVTDSTANMPQQLLEQYNIHVVSLSVVFESESYREVRDISIEDFYEKMRQSKQLPTTSQPAIGTFIDLFEKLSEDYDEIISIHISSNLSGTFEAARSAANIVENINVHVFDTHLSAMPQGFFAIEAAEMVAQGETTEAILAKLEQMKETTLAYFMVDDLTNLQRGGRLSSAQAILGSLLNVKPILHLVDGFIVPFEKIRTRRRAIKRMMDMLYETAQNEKLRRVVFIHGNNEQAALELQTQFKERHPEIDTLISAFGPVLATHLGENSLGISWYPE